MAAKKAYQQNPFEPRVRDLAELDTEQPAPAEAPIDMTSQTAFAPISKPSNPYVGAPVKEKPDADIVALWKQKPEARADLESEYDFSAIKPAARAPAGILEQIFGSSPKPKATADFGGDLASQMNAGDLTNFASRVIGVAPSLLTTAAMHAFSPSEDLAPGQSGPHQRQITVDDYLKSARGEHPKDVAEFAEARGASPNVAAALDFGSNLLDPALVSPMRKIAGGVTSKLGTGIENTGRRVYRSVWPKVAQSMKDWRQYESPDVSPNIMADVAERLGLKGSWQKMLDQGNAAVETLSENVVAPIIKKMKGFDPGLALVTAKREFQKRAEGVPDYAEPMQEVEEIFKRDIGKTSAPIPADIIQKRKQAASKLAAGSERNPRNIFKSGAATDLEQQALAKKGSIYRKLLETEAEKQLGAKTAKKLTDANQAMSALYGGKKAMKQLAKAEAGKEFLSQMDWMLGAGPVITGVLGGGARGALAAAAPLALKTAARVINSPVTRTHAGLGLIKGGKLLQEVPSSAWERLGRLGVDLNPIEEK